MHSSVDSRSTSSSVELTHEAALSSSSTEAPALAPVPRLALAWRGGVNPRLTERPRRPKSARRRMAARAWPQTRGRAPQALLGRASNARVQVGQERAEGGHTKSSLMGRWDAMLCAVQRCRWRSLSRRLPYNVLGGRCKQASKGSAACSTNPLHANLALIWSLEPPSHFLTGWRLGPTRPDRRAPVGRIAPHPRRAP